MKTKSNRQTNLTVSHLNKRINDLESLVNTLIDTIKTLSQNPITVTPVTNLPQILPNPPQVIPQEEITANNTAGVQPEEQSEATSPSPELSVVHSIKPLYINHNFTPKFLHRSTENLVIGTSRCKHISGRNIAHNTTVHAYSGATIDEIIELIPQYPDVRNLKTLVIICGFKHYKNVEEENMIEKWKTLINVAHKKFSPMQIIVPKTISTPIFHIAKKIDSINFSLSCAINQMKHNIRVFSPDPNASLSFNNMFFHSFFQNDYVHLSYIGNSVLNSLLCGYITNFSNFRPLLQTYQYTS